MVEKLKEPVAYGGQAVMEGVLMRGKKSYAMAVRRPDGEIEIIKQQISTLAERFPILRLPLIRGFMALCSSIVMGYKAMSKSADIAMGGEIQPESRFEKWLSDKLGDKLNSVMMVIAMVLAVVLAMGLFMLLPAFIGSLIPVHSALTGVIEGFVRIAIFIAYVFIISRAKDIQRVFQYHGAEHKVINCFEQKLPLTLENVQASNRLHKRCGTSFMLVVMFITMILFMIIRVDGIWLRFASRILLLPVIAGISYEVSVKWAGKRDNWLVSAIIAPGMLMQRMTTAEPDSSQIEIATVALEKVLEAEDSDKIEEIGLEAKQEVTQ